MADVSNAMVPNANIDATTVPDTIDCSNLEIRCPKCNEQFFLKSNLDMHMLFCNDNKDVEYPSNETTEHAEPVDETSNKEMINSVSLDGNTLRDSLEMYVPLGECNPDCKTCTERFPVGSFIGDVDVTELLCNSTKKVISDRVEVFECIECHRDYLYKQPTVAKQHTTDTSPTTTAFTMLKTRKFLNKPYKCHICNRGFDTEHEMVLHVSNHSNATARYSCGKCKEKFSTRSMLQKHYESALNTCEPRTCNICSKEFVHANHLRRHMSIHSGSKPFVCEICSHAFNQKSDLKRHLLRHTVEGKLLACIKCSLIFDSVKQLKEHAVTHNKTESSGRPEYNCELCSKVFGRKSHYKRHLTIHQGLKPHKCLQCDKSFNQKTDLKRHELSHARKSQAAALKDSGIFSNGEGVGRGVLDGAEMVSKDVRYLCPICNDVFTSRDQYDEHENIHKKFLNTDMTLSHP